MSIVTPSLNMAPFLEQAIQSVLTQDYPNLEYLVMDGGSTDGTLDILRKYEGRLRWDSRPDRGQCDAVNRGFLESRGSIFAFLCADDAYLPGAVRTAVRHLQAHPQYGGVYGEGHLVNEQGAILCSYPTREFDPELLRRECIICQPAAFLRREVFAEAGMLDPDLHHALDHDLWIRVAKRRRLLKVDEYLALSRMHRGAKTLGQRRMMYRKHIEVLLRHYGYAPVPLVYGYCCALLDARDGFYEPIPASLPKYALTWLVGSYRNWRHPLKYWKECLDAGLDAWRRETWRPWARLGSGPRRPALTSEGQPRPAGADSIEDAAPAHHAVFSDFRPYSGPAERGFEVDFIGARTRCEFCPAGVALPDRVVRMSHPPVDEEYFEWVDVLESVLEAKHSFTMFELGAGYGRWLVRAAAALRQRGDLPFRLVAVEAEPRHFEWLKIHFRDNGLEPDEHTLIKAAISDTVGEALFYVGMPEGGKDQPNEWYGQSIVQPYEVVSDEEHGFYEGAVLTRFQSGWKAIRVPTVRLQDLLRGFESIDLVNMDVQGEELEAVSSAIEDLNARVKRLHIGTHSREIEAGLRELLGEHQWECRTDYECAGARETPWGKIEFVDGVQSWVNPRLR